MNLAFGIGWEFVDPAGFADIFEFGKYEEDE
jgi:hypothetical protein